MKKLFWEEKDKKDVKNILNVSRSKYKQKPFIWNVSENSDL